MVKKETKVPIAAVDIPQSSKPMHYDINAIWQNWYEFPREDDKYYEVYTYTDALSYSPGETVNFHTSSTAKIYSLEIEKDGAETVSIYKKKNLAGVFYKTPKDAYKNGCKWPITHSWKVPNDCKSGFYLVTSRCVKLDGSEFIQHHGFAVRPKKNGPRGNFLLILTTGTWTAYNDWGGANHYEGIDGHDNIDFSPTLSLERPWTRGMVWLPEGAPRIGTTPKPKKGEIPRYQNLEWAYAYSYGRYYAAAGWAQYERHFVVWAERQGYKFDIITQTDLHYRPEILAEYKTATIVGHDEYWSRGMRDNLDSWVEEGGKVARFGGNFCWQTRLVDEGKKQICYKYRAQDEDPVRDTDNAHLLTSAWEDQKVNYPGATTFGINGFRGVYVGLGGFSPRNSRGFTVYRPEHWIFDNTDLYYGDVFGSEAQIFAFEVDGLDYTFRHGLPYPTGEDGAPENVEILAMNVAAKEEVDHGNPGSIYYVLDGDLQFGTLALEGKITPELIDKNRYGSGMIVHMPKGEGEVVSTSTCEWVMGLKHNDEFTVQITRNILDQFCLKE